MTDAVAALQKSLREAVAALTGGDAADAERRAKAITAPRRARCGRACHGCDRLGER